MADDKTVNDIFEKIGQMSGKMDTFMEAQAKNTEYLFSSDRKQNIAISSLQQTRRTQWKVIGLLGTFSATIAAFAHKIFPTIPPQ